MDNGAWKADGSGRPGLGMFLLRAWMWMVPIVMLAGSAVFSVVAALEGDWALMGVMLVIGVFGLILGLVHAWLLYRFRASPH